MKSSEIRKSFLDFFQSKQHKIVASAPIVNKNDPTLMFTNAGMNQFKDYFLGNKTPDYKRIADTQKCLRVSGKHNDLEEVGFDGTHHTMFEMLGNWSFGDYFKNEAIEWSWEYLTSVCKLPKDRLYATIFEGDEKEKLERDTESFDFWTGWLPESHIVNGNKKDNFWEMGDTGPCGPCTEIHIDLRSDEERQLIPGETLVNKDHPMVIEIWNNVFIQYNRKADRSLEPLPDKHVDTGMGFERLCMVLQGQSKSYESDVFTPLIKFIESRTGIRYTASYERDAKSDIAMRVMADHIRAVAFCIADGELPSNGGAGYVIRRVLRRAVRYCYSFLNHQEPLLYALVHLLADEMGEVFPELEKQREFISKVVLEEEKSFLRTLEGGLKRFETLQVQNGTIEGQIVFELYDTFGFPIDLTRLIAEERGLTIDEKGFEKALAEQKARSRADAVKEVGDWLEVHGGKNVEFMGYDSLEVRDTNIQRTRTVMVKGEPEFQIVLSKTPFYGESGGQAGDRGMLFVGDEMIQILDTKKENELIIHLADKLPTEPKARVHAVVNPSWRQDISSNHSAVHLMHAALHKIIGNHAVQKGQDVNDLRLRFDFSHFQKLSEKELADIENMVNEKILDNIPLDEKRDVPIKEAEKMGAMMLFGEKYGDKVRVITLGEGFSTELCGGTHVSSTGQIAGFRILSESSVAAGVRRIEALTGRGAMQWVNQQIAKLDQISSFLKAPKDLVAAVGTLQDENKKYQKELEVLHRELAQVAKSDLRQRFQESKGVHYLIARLTQSDNKSIKDLATELSKDQKNSVVVFGFVSNEKPQIMVVVNEELVDSFHAGNMVKALAQHIKGGGGGQPLFATAGGVDVNGLDLALKKAEEYFI